MRCTWLSSRSRPTRMTATISIPASIVQSSRLSLPRCSVCTFLERGSWSSRKPGASGAGDLVNGGSIAAIIGGHRELLDPPAEEFGIEKDARPAPT